jgi:hypothetical protein
MENLCYFLNTITTIFNLNVASWGTCAVCSPIITTTQSALRLVHRLNQSDLSTERDLVLPL